MHLKHADPAAYMSFYHVIYGINYLLRGYEVDTKLNKTKEIQICLVLVVFLLYLSVLYPMLNVYNSPEIYYIFTLKNFSRQKKQKK